MKFDPAMVQKTLDTFGFGVLFAFGFSFGNWLIGKIPWPAM